MAEDKIKCVFFDRDGIVNESPGAGYVTRREDFHLVPEFVECLRLAQARGYRSAVVTNQRAVARGLITRAALEGIHSCMRAELRRREAPALLDIIYCPHNPGECDCRKPQPGMILRGLAEWRGDPAASFLIGDKESDIAAATAAGINGYLFTGSNMLEFVKQNIPGIDAE